MTCYRWPSWYKESLPNDQIRVEKVQIGHYQKERFAFPTFHLNTQSQWICVAELSQKDWGNTYNHPRLQTFRYSCW